MVKKIEHRVKVSAVIPTQQYGNIQPEIEFNNVDDYQKYLDGGLEVMEKLFDKYSEKGGLNKREFIQTSVAIEKTSFNEGVKVLFDPIPHTYKCGDRELQSATSYIKRFYKPFEQEKIAESCSKLWGVDAQSIKDLWKDNGTITSEFGTAVHLALELFFKNQKVGETITQNKKEQDGNYAMPKHPIIKNIIQGFINVSGKHQGDLVSEALLTNLELGLCGHADRVLILDQEKKICRVQDYKINIGAEKIKKEDKPLEPWSELPANKLTKYQLQLSIYANMLEKSGWTVTGLDVFVLDEEWKHYELEVLQVI